MKTIYKLANGKLYESEVDVSHKEIGECPFCGKQVLASPGQAITFYKDQPVHKSCCKKQKK